MSEVTSDRWKEYFQDLNREPVNPPFTIKTLLDKIEKEKIFSELDNTISNAEISKAISSLKNKNSCGFDLISNEMIKKQSNVFIEISK